MLQSAEAAEYVPQNATRNACKLCAPLGASLAFRGVEGAVPFLHGSQGCATYIRRYTISHFREPVDIAWCMLYLASDAARFVTGQVLRPNGGVVMP